MTTYAGSDVATFRSRLLSQELLVGTFVKTPSMMVAEVLAQTDLDVVCIDAEHSPFDRRDIDQSLFAYSAANKPSLVRVPSSSPEQILNALDCGATGVVVPHVDSVEKAEACARASRYGDGGRGYAGSTRAAAYGGNKIAENLIHNTNETTVIAQIEDLAALDCIDGIAAVEGIDCLFIGMMDLTVALGQDSAKAPEVLAAAEKICAAATAVNRSLGIFVPDAADIPFWQERGVRLFLLASDHAFIKQGAARLVAAAKPNG
jgi:2-keto-3-deoxy-L-rhamnonate aldolase RhmA